MCTLRHSYRDCNSIDRPYGRGHANAVDPNFAWPFWIPFRRSLVLVSWQVFSHSRLLWARACAYFADGVIQRELWGHLVISRLRRKYQYLITKNSVAKTLGIVHTFLFSFHSSFFSNQSQLTVLSWAYRMSIARIEWSNGVFSCVQQNYLSGSLL